MWGIPLPRTNLSHIFATVGVTIMGYSACGTHPLPYNASVQTCRAREGLTVAAHARGISFRDFFHHPAGPMAHCFQGGIRHTNRCVIHRLGLAFEFGLRHLRRRQIAYIDVLIRVHYIAAILVSRVLSSPAHFPMKTFGLLFVTVFLCFFDAFFFRAVVSAGKRRSVGCGEGVDLAWVKPDG